MEVTFFETDVISASKIHSAQPTNDQSFNRTEFMNALAQRLGKHYGLNDIREAR